MSNSHQKARKSSAKHVASSKRSRARWVHVSEANVDDCFVGNQVRLGGLYGEIIMGENHFWAKFSDDSVMDMKVLAEFPEGQVYVGQPKISKKVKAGLEKWANNFDILIDSTRLKGKQKTQAMHSLVSDMRDYIKYLKATLK